MSIFSDVRIVNTAVDLYQVAAMEFASRAHHAIGEHGRFSVALSGGSTPRGLYAILASGYVPAIAWDKIFFFWSDERQVAPDHPDSNYRMAKEALLTKVPVSPEQIFRIHTEETDANLAAQSYEETLRTVFGVHADEIPRFDLILLGIGTEGHTASLFPGTAALDENEKWVAGNWVEKLKANRITFTYQLLNHAACVLFLVSGAEKAPILRQILEVPGAHLPAQRVQPVNGRLLWLADREAASALSDPPARSSR